MSANPSTSVKAATLSYRELQKQCIGAGLTAVGSTEVLRKRLQDHLHLQNSNQNAAEATTVNPSAVLPSEDTDVDPSAKRAAEETNVIPSPKRPRKSMIEDDLLCPISLFLPFEPVIAEDGRIYERSAIEQYFHGKEASIPRVKSPMSGALMGKRLLAAPQIKNTIETSIENGFITNPELVAKWREREEQKKEGMALLKKAEAGDVKSMEIVGDYFAHGQFGFRFSKQAGYQWYDKARKAGSVKGLTEVGDMLLRGDGVAAQEKLGFLYLTQAAEKGSDWACFWLGIALAQGKHGLPVNKEEAIRWLKRSVATEYRIMEEDGRRNAAKLLAQLLEEETGTSED